MKIMYIKNFIFWDITPCRTLKIDDVSEEHVTSIFWAEELVVQEKGVKRIASREYFYRK
jgi:hypothetical protein